MLRTRYSHPEPVYPAHRNHPGAALHGGFSFHGLGLDLLRRRLQLAGLSGLLLLLGVIGVMRLVGLYGAPGSLSGTPAPAPVAMNVPAPVATADAVPEAPHRVIHRVHRAVQPPAPAPKISIIPRPGKSAMELVQTCKPADRTFANGEELSAPLPSAGHGRVVIINGTPSDAVVKISRRSAPGSIRSVYVGAGREVRLDQIDAGDYHLMFTLGTGWSLDQRKFCTSPEYSEFSKDLHFSEKLLVDQIEYDQAQVTLNGVLGGNIPVKKVSEQEFLADR